MAYNLCCIPSIKEYDILELKYGKINKISLEFKASGKQIEGVLMKSPKKHISYNKSLDKEDKYYFRKIYYYAILSDESNMTVKYNIFIEILVYMTKYFMYNTLLDIHTGNCPYDCKHEEHLKNIKFNNSLNDRYNRLVEHVEGFGIRIIKSCIENCIEKCIGGCIEQSKKDENIYEFK